MICRKRLLTSILLAGLLCGGLMLLGQSPRKMPSIPADQARTLGLALSEVDNNQPESALKQLNQLLDAKPHPLVGHTAALLRSQLTGQFTARQQTHLGRKVLPVVVLVPDEATFLKAIAGWDETTFYPILIEDGWFTPIFIKRFAPQTIVRWSEPSPEKSPASPAPDLAKVALAHNHWLASSKNRPAPPGLVVIDPADPQRMGGLALAIGRGQPIHLLANKNKTTTILTAEQTDALNKTLVAALLRWQLTGFGQWCGLTLAGDLPVRYTMDFHGQVRRFAVDDRLGRAPNGLRLAVTGRLWGTPSQSVYMAMGSLFLPPRHALLFDDYSNRSAGFAAYRLGQAEQILRTRMTVQRVSGIQTNPLVFRRLTRSDDPFDLIWINTHGSSRTFHVRGLAVSDDLPIDQSMAIYMIHSFSAASPWSYNNLAGRAMRGGAFWFFGSVDEPYLHAFVRPTGMCLKIVAGTPLAMAARQLPGQPMSQPWKLMTFGDPLYALRAKPAERLTQRPLAHTRPIDAPTTAGDDLATSFHNAVLLNREDVLTWAKKIIAQLDAMDPADVDRAAWLLWRDKQYQTLAVLQPGRLDQSLVAKWTVWQSGLKMFYKSLDAGSVRACQLLLERLLAIGWAQPPLDQCLDKWIALASSADHHLAVKTILLQQKARKLPYYSKKAVEAALAKLQPSN